MSMLAGRLPCSKCGAFHGVPPLAHLLEDDDCGHDPEHPCKECGEPVGGLSTDGPEVCSWCACGISIEERKEQAPIYDTVAKIGESVPPEDWADVPKDAAKNFKQVLYGGADG